MSLLIKALDNAEKNKKAEQSKNPADKTAAAPTLELEAIERKPAIDTTSTTQQELPEIATSSFAANHLTLEEEAGLSLAIDPKYSKPKRGAEKPAAKSAPAKSDAQSASLSNSNETAHTKVPVLPPVFQNLAAQNAVEHEQKSAAKVFAANQAIQKGSSKTTLILLGVAGALVIWLGLQGYRYIQTLLAPKAVVVTPAAAPAVNTQEMAAVAAEAAQSDQESTEAAPPPSIAAQGTVNQTGQVSAANSGEEPLNTAGTARDANAKPAKVEELTQDEVVSADSNLVAEAKPINKNKRINKPNSIELGSDESAVPSSASNNIKLVRKPSVSGVDPTLAAAYQAFVRGEDATAQQQYRQVLQRDVRNIDALLGMAAIAQRQGRDGDAFGWYQKVLEIEPRNTIAQTALINAQPSSDGVAGESRIKSLLAQQPEAANLHAALGNLYANQNQWPAAQEAYFNASRYAPNNADYAFNLAVSLEQLGKPGLALIQYQRTLDLVNQSGAASPDKTQIAARIRALQ